MIIYTILLKTLLTQLKKRMNNPKHQKICHKICQIFSINILSVLYFSEKKNMIKTLNPEILTIWFEHMEKVSYRNSFARQEVSCSYRTLEGRRSRDSVPRGRPCYICTPCSGPAGRCSNSNISFTKGSRGHLAPLREAAKKFLSGRTTMRVGGG